MQEAKAGQAIASMGYPDILIAPEELKAGAGEAFGQIRYRPESQQICKRHGISFRLIPDAEALFELFGLSLDVYDIQAERGGEICLDLNKPYPENSKAQYEWVLDVGTLEHCFNVAQALANMAGLVKLGGHIIHENPLNWGNHGFYNFCPTFFYDFYRDNGFEVLESLVLVHKSNQFMEPPPVKRFLMPVEKCNLFTIAKRVEIKDFVWPIQSKYREKK